MVSSCGWLEGKYKYLNRKDMMMMSNGVIYYIACIMDGYWRVSSSKKGLYLSNPFSVWGKKNGNVRYMGYALGLNWKGRNLFVVRFFAQWVVKYNGDSEHF